MYEKFSGLHRLSLDTRWSANFVFSSFGSNIYISPFLITLITISWIVFNQEKTCWNTTVHSVNAVLLLLLAVSCWKGVLCQRSGGLVLVQIWSEGSVNRQSRCLHSRCCRQTPERRTSWGAATNKTLQCNSTYVSPAQQTDCRLIGVRYLVAFSLAVMCIWGTYFMFTIKTRIRI